MIEPLIRSSVQSHPTPSSPLVFVLIVGLGCASPSGSSSSSSSSETTAETSAVTTQSSGAEADPGEPTDAGHRWVTVFTGMNHCLDVVNGGDLHGYLQMRPCAQVSGQTWHTRNTDEGWVRFSSEFLGSEMCVDIVNGGPHDGHAHLAPCGAANGQLWRLTPDGEHVRLTTQFRGEGMCLDVVNEPGAPNDRMLHLQPCADLTGQQWQQIDHDQALALH